MDTIERVNNGEVVVLPKRLQQLDLLRPLNGIFRTAIRQECPSRKYGIFKKNGLEHVHKVLNAKQLMRVYKKVEGRLFSYLPDVMDQIVRSVDAPRPLYIHTNSIARIMVPVKHLDDSFIPRPGRLYPYEGVHQDGFQYGLTDVINFWMAISHVKEGNGIEIYPDMWGQRLPQVGLNLNIEELNLTEPVRYALEPGDILVFHSQHIHTSVLNTTNQTRVALTSRICPDGSKVDDWEWKRYE